MGKCVVLCFLVFMVGLPAIAQSKWKHRIDSIAHARHYSEKADSLRFRLDSMLDAKSRRINYNPSYIRKPPYRLTLKGRMRVSGGRIETRSTMNGETSRTDLESDMKSTVSVAANYRGISLGLALNPAHLVGKYNDFEFNLNSYNNKYGYDAVFQSSKSYRGDLLRGGATYHISRGFIRQNMLNLTAYYVFNNQRFSYPAAFSQTYEQLRSSGSLLAGLSFMGGNLYAPSDNDMGSPSIRISMGHLGIGCGYGYNLVTKRQWLFHLSSLPTLVFVSRTRLSVGGQRNSMSYQFPEVLIVGRGAVIHSFKNYFAGLTFVVNTSSVGSQSDLLLRYQKWQGCLLFGVRL